MSSAQHRSQVSQQFFNSLLAHLSFLIQFLTVAPVHLFIAALPICNLHFPWIQWIPWPFLPQSSRKPAQRAIRDPHLSVIPDGAKRRSRIQEGMNHGGMDRRGFWIPGLASLARNDEKKKPLGRNGEEVGARQE